MPEPAPVIDRIAARAFRIPTDAPEADGTLAWDHTTLVVAEVSAGGALGLGYTYAGAQAASLINEVFAALLTGADASAIGKAWERMFAAVRNLGSRGICATAISAVDSALWDLKAKSLGRPLVHIFGAARDGVPIYGSGGFTSYSRERLSEQLSHWVEEDGCAWVKMKVGSEPEQDPVRVKAARAAIGAAGLFVDANGAYARKQALEFAYGDTINVAARLEAANAQLGTRICASATLAARVEKFRGRPAGDLILRVGRRLCVLSNPLGMHNTQIPRRRVISRRLPNWKQAIPARWLPLQLMLGNTLVINSPASTSSGS